MTKRQRKSLPILVAVMILFCSFAYAEEQAELRLTGVESEGQYIVTIDLIGTDSIEMLQFCVSYDSDLLILKKILVGSAFKGASYPTVSGDIPGKLFLAWDALTPLKAGQLLVAEFTAKENVSGIAEIGIDASEPFVAADENYQFIEMKRNAVEFVLFSSEDDDFEDAESQKDVTEIDIADISPEDKDAQISAEAGLDIQPSPNTIGDEDKSQAVLWINDDADSAGDSANDNLTSGTAENKKTDSAEKASATEVAENAQAQQAGSSNSNDIAAESTLLQTHNITAITVVIICCAAVVIILGLALMKKRNK